ncbi:MAG TPA: molybdopterin-dependent oxidoreductase [Ktedonobacterales bacterium]|nr:molybdopterin-dependent oxidoreductase [Ktedonobacterales bacterium]
MRNPLLSLRHSASVASATLRERTGEVARQARRDGPRVTSVCALRILAATLRLNVPALIAGLFGSVAAIVVMGWLRVTWGTPTAPELVGERILPNLSAGEFVALLIQFEPHPKTTPLGLALLGMFVLGVLLAPLYILLARVPTHSQPRSGRWPARRAWITAAAFALAMEVLAVLLFWPVLPEGLFGDPIATARLLTITSLLLTFTSYALVMALASWWLYRAWGRWAAPAALSPRALDRVGALPAAPAAVDAVVGALPAAPADTVTRRTALVGVGATVVYIAAGYIAFNRILAGYFARSNLAYEGRGTPGHITSPITPNDQFYVVSKNVLDPTVDASRWELEITGHVRQPKIWTYATLRTLPRESRAITMECISNGIGGNLMSTAVWQGVTLQTLLAEAGGALTSAKYAVFYSIDGYATSLPLADLLQARTLLAYGMNGVPLPQRHGFPLRAVVPGRYGEQSAKWVTRIELTDTPYLGFYQSQGWSAAQLETNTRIDTPRARAPLGPVTVAGIAFAGIRGIASVEISADGGATWNTATLLPPLSDQTWVFWRWIWNPLARGAYTLVARATDGTGAVQVATDRGTVPDGATGLYRAKVVVA